MAENTFLGLQPYTEDDAYRFKGRTEESQELFRLIVRNDFTVCYAESGEGKTSLLNAGVFPLLRENMYFPIAITFTSDDYQVTPDNFSSIIDRCIKDSITEYNEKNKGVNVEYRLCSTDFQDLDCQAELQQELSKYSWWKLRNYKPQAMGLTFTPVFVFDQFEEVFNMPGSIVWTKKFFDWLEDVSSDSCPDEIVKKIRAIIGNSAAFPSIKEEKDFKAVFSLRKEFIGELDYWGMQKCFIPSLKDNRYCLKALTYEGAKKVITQQERFDEEKVEQILTHFVRQYSREPEKTIKEQLPIIPALLLSVVCDSWEKDITSFAKLSTDEISQSLNKILEKFYDDTIDAVIKELGSQNASPLDSDSIRKDIDVAMFDLVDVNGKRVRVKAVTTLGTISMESKKRFSETLPIVKYKEILNQHRIVKITKIDGEDYVEIVHDCLCPIIAKRREMRLAEEAKEGEEWLLHEQKRKMRKRMLLMSIVVLLAFGIIGIILFQMHQVKVAQQQMKEKQEKMLVNQSRYISATASMLVDEGDFYTARLLALEALPSDLEHPNRPYTVEAESALRKASMYDSLIIGKHKEPVVDAVFSPNGKFVVSGSSEGAIFIWDVHKKTCVKELKGHSDCICSLSYSFDGKLIVSASNDHTVKIWNSETGRCLKTLRGHEDKVYCASFSSDAKKVVSASRDKAIKIWDVNSGQCLNTLVGHNSAVNTAFFDTQDNRIVSSSIEMIKIWDAISGHCIKTINKESGFFIDYALFCPGDNAIAYIVRGVTAGYYHIIVQEIESGDKLLTLKGHVDLIRTLSFSHNGQYIVSASRDMTVKIWDIKSGTCLRTIPQPCIAHYAHFSPDDSQVVVSLMDSTICLWNIDQNSFFRTIGVHKGSVFYADYSPKNDYIVSSSFDGENLLNIWDCNKGVLLLALRGHSDMPLSSTFSKDGKYIVSSSRDKSVKIWDVNKRGCIKTLKGHSYWVYDAVFSPDGKLIASASYDKTIRIWDVKSGDCLKVLEDHDGFVYDVDFSRDGKYLCSTSQDKVIKIWEVSTWKCIKTLVGHSAWVGDADFSPDGKFVVSASGDYTIKVWNIEKGTCVKTIVGHKLGVKSVDYSPNGKYLVSSSVDETIRLWDVKTGKCIQTLIDGLGEFATVHFSPNGRHIVAASLSNGGKINIWDYLPLQELIEKTHQQLNNRKLTSEERQKFYLE